MFAGYPLSDFKATLYDGSFHPVDSNELSFKIAASMALKDGVHAGEAGAPGADHDGRRSASPSTYMGEVNRDLNGRRGRVLGMDTTDGMQVITAHVPQAELFSYATELRSLTGGRGTFSAELDHYEDVPGAHRREGHRDAQEEGAPRGALTRGNGGAAAWVPGPRLRDAATVARAATGAACAIFDGDGRVLLVHHTYGRLNWELPGGLSEPGEAPDETARQGALEETGSGVEPDRSPACTSSPATNLGPMLHFVFTCGWHEGLQPVASSPEVSEAFASGLPTTCRGRSRTSPSVESTMPPLEPVPGSLVSIAGSGVE